MNAIDPNPRAILGHNQPPEPTPYELSAQEVADLYAEAKLWLDGAAVADQDQADGLSNLLNLLRAAEKHADAARKAEKEPFADAAKAVDAKYKPLIEKVQRAAEGCKKALSPWLEKLEAEKRAAAEEARRKAEEAQAAAQAAMRDAERHTDLAAAEDAEEKLKIAKAAEKAANRAEKSTAKAGGAVGRAVSLRTVYRPVMTDARALAAHYWTTDREAVVDFFLSLAERDVRAGKRNIPGIRVDEEKVAV